MTAGSPSTEGIGVSTSHNLTNHLVYFGTPYDYYFQNGLEASLFNNGNSKNSMPPNNVMPEVIGKYVVKNPGYVDITVSGIPSSNTWYLNISGISGIVEHGVFTVSIIK